MNPLWNGVWTEDCSPWREPTAVGGTTVPGLQKSGYKSAVEPRQGDISMGVLDGKVAVVTGSARGIGRATAELLAEQGASVLVNDLDGDVAEEASNEIQGETVAFSGDLTKGDTPDQLVQKAVDSFGKIDIIVNNAG